MGQPILRMERWWFHWEWRFCLKCIHARAVPVLEIGPIIRHCQGRPRLVGIDTLGGTDRIPWAFVT